LLVFWQPELYKLEESLPSFWSFHSWIIIIIIKVLFACLDSDFWFGCLQ
jgi:hypothetical protein